MCSCLFFVGSDSLGLYLLVDFLRGRMACESVADRWVSLGLAWFWCFGGFLVDVRVWYLCSGSFWVSWVWALWSGVLVLGCPQVLLLGICDSVIFLLVFQFGMVGLFWGFLGLDRLSSV